MKEASCLALFSITYHEERAVNCLKKDFFFSLAEGNWKRRANWKYNLLRIKGPQKFIRSNRPRNFCGSLSQKFLWTVVPEISVDPCLRNFCRWVVVSEISADESLSQKFLRVSRCQRNFCGSYKLYFLSCVFANVLQTSETTVINAYRQETNNFWNILP